MGQSTWRHSAAAPTHAITTTAYRFDHLPGLVVEQRLVQPDFCSCCCCWQTRQLGPGLWHGSWNGQGFTAAGRSDYLLLPQLWSWGWDDQGLVCSCWDCGQSRLHTRPQVWSPTRSLLGFPFPGPLARESRHFFFVCFVFCFVGPLVVLGSRSLWHLRPGVNGRERNPVNSPQFLKCWGS